MDKFLFRLYFIVNKSSKQVSDDFLNDLKPMLWVDFLGIVHATIIVDLFQIISKINIPSWAVFYYVFIVIVVNYFYFNYRGRWKKYNSEFIKMNKIKYNLWVVSLIIYTIVSTLVMIYFMSISGEMYKNGLLGSIG